MDYPGASLYDILFCCALTMNGDNFLDLFLIIQAKINIGGHLLNAITIEHFILRLPYYSKYVSGAHFNFQGSFFRKSKTFSHVIHS